jgi:hypothetical protein
MVSKIGINIDSHIRAGNMGRTWAVVKGGVKGRNGETAKRRKGEGRIPG